MNKVTLNCYMLFKKQNIQRGNKITYVEFQLKLIERLLQEYHIEQQQEKRGRPSTDEGDPL